MSRTYKIILLAVSGFAVILIFIAVALIVFVDTKAYKPQLEAAATAALGMEVRIEGRLGIGFSPGLLLTLRDVHILNGGRILSRPGRSGSGLVSSLCCETKSGSGISR